MDPNESVVPPIDPREEKLPAWARTLLSRMRSEIRVLEADVADAAAARAAMEKAMPAEGATISVILADGSEFGLPSNAIVTYGVGSRQLTVENDKGTGLQIEAISTLAVLPAGHSTIRVRSDA